MSKYLVKSPILHDGKPYATGSMIELAGTNAKRLLAVGAIGPVIAPSKQDAPPVKPPDEPPENSPEEGEAGESTGEPPAAPPSSPSEPAKEPATPKSRWGRARK